jgi:phage FluMu protein Com
LTNKGITNKLSWRLEKLIVARYFGDFVMEEGRKKPIMLGVIVVCFVLAGVIYLKTRSGGADYRRLKGQTWVVCRNDTCGHSWQMDLVDYHEFIEKNADPRVPLAPPVTCPECGEPSGYRAVKCAQCGAVFEEGTVPADFADKCPKCGYSQTKVNRDKAAEERRAAKEAKDKQR